MKKINSCDQRGDKRHNILSIISPMSIHEYTCVYMLMNECVYMSMNIYFSVYAISFASRHVYICLCLEYARIIINNA